MHNYEKLQIYQDAKILVRVIYKLTDTFPRHELYGITSQIRRATVSVALNIAEGNIKSRKECARFIDISSGSLLEVRVALQISRDLGYINLKDLDETSIQIDNLFRQLMSFRNYLRTIAGT